MATDGRTPDPRTGQDEAAAQDDVEEKDAPTEGGRRPQPDERASPGAALLDPSLDAPEPNEPG